MVVRDHDTHTNSVPRGVVDTYDGARRATKHPAAPRTLLAVSRRTLAVISVLGISLSLVFLWLAIRKVDLADVWEILTAARPGLVAIAVAAMAIVYALQAERWRRIADQPATTRGLFGELVISGVAVNNVLPGRLGDVLRARWLGLDVSIPGGRALATVVVDRGFDLLTLVAFLLLSLPFVTDAHWLDRIVVGGLLGLACLAVLLLFARMYTRRRSRERRRRRSLLRRVARDLAEGLAVPLGPARAVAAALLSVAAWGAWGALRGSWLVPSGSTCRCWRRPSSPQR